MRNRIVEGCHLSPVSLSFHFSSIARTGPIFWGSVIQNSAVAPSANQWLHAIYLVTNLEVLDIVADRRDDSRKFLPWYPACALFLFSFKLTFTSPIM